MSTSTRSSSRRSRNRAAPGSSASASEQQYLREPALFLHGGPGMSDYTGGLAEELAGRFEPVRHQQRGVAPGPLDGPFTVEQFAADAVAVLDECGLARAWLVGHSWGAHLAMHVAVTHPERVVGIVAVGALGAL